jgi:hypothetical protein
MPAQGEQYKLQIVQSQLRTLKSLHAVELVDRHAFLFRGMNKRVSNRSNHARTVEGVAIINGWHVAKVV